MKCVLRPRKMSEKGKEWAKEDIECVQQVKGKRKAPL
jgi:hypothetical protein